MHNKIAIFLYNMHKTFVHQAHLAPVVNMANYTKIGFVQPRNLCNITQTYVLSIGNLYKICDEILVIILICFRCIQLHYVL